ncbi:SAM-dependent methyltransferase [Amycolatopsis pithecellobii]|uniref:SAM-dependent methyltransferase n=1 Tax=Amycolatopsis pithecellobii TaxID=664692 RepID=UPI001409138B|nr:SAM-dependent methyltransferase [Amycolatopsis pithecellobii]
MSAPEGVRATALLTAYARAQESARPDRLFDDPLARLFVAEATAFTGDGLPRVGMAREHDGSPVWQAVSSYFSGRVPFYDEHVLRAVRAGARQLVLLGANLDTRAYRLGLPEDTTVFELDSSSVLEFKRAVLTRHGARPTCRRVPVPAALRAGWPEDLLGAGFAPEEPVVWLAEGLLAYFTTADSDQLLAGISKHSRGPAWLVSDYPQGPVDPQLIITCATDEAERMSAMMMADLVRRGPDVTPEKWVGRHGWTAEVTDLTAQLRHHGRPFPNAFADATTHPVPVWLFSATRDAGPLTG